jgi:hypothetical protein
MDDLLTAFRTEVAQDLDACAADLERVRRSPGEAAAIADLHRRLSSIREMSVVLGQRELADAASRGIDALEVAKRGDPRVVANAVPAVAECLAQIRSVLGMPGAEVNTTREGAQPAPLAAASQETTAIHADASPPRKRGSRATDGEDAQDSRFRRNDTPEVSGPDPAKAPVAPHRAPRRRRWYRPRNILLGGATTIAGAAAAMVLVVLSADPNDYRGVFESTLQAATGRDVTIGNIEFAVSLSPTIVLEDVALANADWGSRRQMVTADRVEVQMALLPLARGEFRGKRFTLHGADILLETDAGGRGNWELDPDDGNPSPAPASEPTTLPQLKRLTIEDSTLTYRDGQTGETETFELARVTARPGDQPTLMDIDADTVINGQAVSFAGTVGGPELLQGPAPYPVDLTGEVAGLNIALRGQVAQPLHGRGYSLAMTASGESLTGLGTMLAADLPPGSPVQLTGVLEDADGAIRVRDIAAQIGRSDAAGEVIVRPGEPNWGIEVDLTGRQVDLEDFIAADTGTDAGLDDPRLFSGKPLPYRWMRKIDLTGKVRADRVVHGDTTLTAAALDGTIAAGRLTLDRLQFGYAGGEVTLMASGDVNPATPLWTLQGSGRGLAGGDTLGLLGLTMIRGGKADLQIGASASGGSLREIVSSLDGGAGMTLANGHIDDDLMRLFLTDLTQAVSLRGGGAQLRCMTAIFDFTDGNGRARTFVADTGAAVVSGVGQVSLRNETIGMTFQPAAKDVSLAALAVPVHVTGPLGNPDVSPDAMRATANVAGSAAGLATGGLAGAVLGLVGADVALDDAPIASCSALPASFAAGPPQAPETAAPPAAAASQPASTQTQTTKTATTPAKKTKKSTTKATSKSTTDQILDGASDVVDGVGSALGDVFSGSSSSTTKKPKGNKKDK